MTKTALTETTYKRVVKEVEKHGSSVTGAAEKRVSQGRGLDPLVDPAEHGVIRRALSWYEPEGDLFKLLRGVAMLVETRFDTTGSMGSNVEVAFKTLQKLHGMLSKIPQSALARYDLQMITASFGDVVDRYILSRTQAEMDEEIARQMTYLLPEYGGGDGTEDPQYGLFGGAYLTSAMINKYGLKYYDFTYTDAPSRNYVDTKNLKRVFGKDVFDKVRENGYEIDKDDLPDIKQIMKILLKNAHAFMLLSDSSYANYWRGVYGNERVIILPHAEILPETQTAIVALTEGVVGLQDLEKYLTSNMNLGEYDANRIVRAVSHIPVGVQTVLPNFEKIPKRGDIFAKKGDLYPVENADEAAKPADSDWL